MKLALVGLGYWGGKVLRNLVSLLRAENVVAIDQSEPLVERARADYPGLGFRPDLETALDDPGLSGVVVATPVGSHARLAAMALRSGRPVLVEKPLAASSDEAHRLVELADEVGSTLMVGHTFLFSPRLDRIRTYIEDGTLGAIHYATLSRLALGPYRADVNAIWDLGPHDFSILCSLLGEFPSVIQTIGRSISRPGSPDVAFMSLQFPSGVVAEVSVSRLAPRKIRNTIIVGESKMLVYDDTDADEPIKVHDKSFVLPEGDGFGQHQLTYRTGDTVAPYVSAEEPLARQLLHFVQCVKGEAICRSDGRFGSGIVDALQAANTSYERGGAPTVVDYRVPVRVLACASRPVGPEPARSA